MHRACFLPLDFLTEPLQPLRCPRLIRDYVEQEHPDNTGKHDCAPELQILKVHGLYANLRAEPRLFQEEQRRNDDQHDYSDVLALHGLHPSAF